MFGWLPSSTTPKAGKKQGNDLLVIKFVTFLLLNKAGDPIDCKKNQVCDGHIFPSSLHTTECGIELAP
jgi:hypothetical protein